ncbi:MAG: HPr family phosphocarrier protein [Bacteroidales bacterium]|nr:HPr family phosphocarrier protein [Bacteroidales bacterium]
MVCDKAILTAPTGLHARPAGELVKLVKSFTDSTVQISVSGRSVNAASMLSLLSLGMKCGTEMEISVEGGDEQAVLAAVRDFISAIKE